MLKSVLMWCMAMIVAVTLASCEKSQQEFAHEESPFVTEPVDFELPIEFDTRINYDPWGSYTFVSSTGYSQDHFDPGYYAVKISRSWYNQNSLTFHLVVGNYSTNSNAYAWAFKYNADGSTAYVSGMQTISPGDGGYAFPNITISGSEYIVYVFRVVSAADYIFWYSTL